MEGGEGGRERGSADGVINFPKEDAERVCAGGLKEGRGGEERDCSVMFVCTVEESEIHNGVRRRG